MIELIHTPAPTIYVNTYIALPQDLVAEYPEHVAEIEAALAAGIDTRIILY